MRRVGVAKADSVVDIAPAGALRPRGPQRARAPRAMAVLDPLKVTLTNWRGRAGSDDSRSENHPNHPEMGDAHACRMASDLYIEREDFHGTTRPRSSSASRPDGEVRLKGAYIITLRALCRPGRKRQCRPAADLLCGLRPAAPAAEGANRKVKGTHPLGERASTPTSRARCVCTTRSCSTRTRTSRGRRRGGSRRGDGSARRKTSSPASIPDSLTVVHGPLPSRIVAAGGGRRRLPVPAHGLFLQGQGFHGRHGCVQPRCAAEGQL